ncbi:MAG: ABC transporter substrate-binding protein [Crocosphaera sp.]
MNYFFRQINNNLVSFLLTLLLFCIFTLLVYTWIIPKPSPPLPESPPDFISYGEKSLVSFDQEFDGKRQANEYFQQKNYEEAINILSRVRNEKINDPEALIYLNNAEIEQSGQRHNTIAVIVPVNNNLRDTEKNTGLEILRGVAHAQELFNHPDLYGISNTDTLALKVLIVDDNNNAQQAQDIANFLSDETIIKAVIGHFSSDITENVTPIYEQSQLILISPTSTKTNLGRGRDYVFRTVPTNKQIAQKISNYLKKCQHKRIVVVYNSGSSYSKDLWKEFSKSISAVEKKDLKFDDFPDNSQLIAKIEGFVSQGKNAIVLLPNSTTRGQAIEIIKKFNDKSKYPNLAILGGDSLYNPELYYKNKEKAKNVMVAVPWHYSDSRNNQDFLDISKELWKTYEVSWRTALSYDAALVLVEALKNNPSSRQDINTMLGRPPVENGATGTISFTDGGNRQEDIIQLIKKNEDFKSINLESESVCSAS